MRESLISTHSTIEHHINPSGNEGQRGSHVEGEGDETQMLILSQHRALSQCEETSSPIRGKWLYKARSP